MTLIPPYSPLSELADARQAGTPPTPRAMHSAGRVPASAPAPRSVRARSGSAPVLAEGLAMATAGRLAMVTAGQSATV